MSYFFNLLPIVECSTLIRDEVSITKSTLLKTLPLVSPIFEVKFDVFTKSIPNVDWANAVHLTIGNNVGNHGDRIPGVWLNKKSFWLVASSIDGNTHYHKFWNVSIDTWTSFRIWQDKLPDGSYFFEYSMNDNSIYSISNNDPKSFKNVKVYASDPWHAAVDGKIRNLQICV